MKSLLKSTYSKTKLLIVLFAFSCGSLMMAQAEDTDSLFIGLVRSGPPDHGTGLAGGYLLVYSATDQVSDGDLPFNPHSSYLIYTPDGKLFKSVENHMSRSDEIPEVGDCQLDLTSSKLDRRGTAMSECALLSRPAGKQSSTWIREARNHQRGSTQLSIRKAPKVSQGSHESV